MPEEGVLDPWVAQWLHDNPVVIEEFSPELLTLARGAFDVPVTREIAKVHDEVVDGVPVRVYEHDRPPTGVVVYFHGGGWCIGSVSLMDNVARELAHAYGAAVISVGYRLAPEHPYPAGLQDCEVVTRWALDHAASFGASSSAVVVAGESAGGNLAATVSLWLRDAPPAAGARRSALAGQVLVYPGVDPYGTYPSRSEFSGVILSEAMHEWFCRSYSGGRAIAHDPYVAPLHAASLTGLPPALVVLAGCDLLRDEGRAYARRLSSEGVDTEEVCYPGQPHGFMNLGFPAAADAFETIGRWVRARFSASAS